KYSALSENTNSHLAACALQAQIRCLVAAGKTNAALRIISDTMRAGRFKHATDSQGRLIVANAELLALELINDPASPLFQSIAQTLRQRLLDYSDPVLAAPQRRFLMKELLRLSPNIVLPTLHAEELSAQYAERLASIPPDRQVSPTTIANVWQLGGHQLVAL